MLEARDRLSNAGGARVEMRSLLTFKKPLNSVRYPAPCTTGSKRGRAPRTFGWAGRSATSPKHPEEMDRDAGGRTASQLPIGEKAPPMVDSSSRRRLLGPIMTTERAISATSKPSPLEETPGAEIPLEEPRSASKSPGQRPRQRLRCPTYGHRTPPKARRPAHSSLCTVTSIVAEATLIPSAVSRS